MISPIFYTLLFIPFFLVDYFLLFCSVFLVVRVMLSLLSNFLSWSSTSLLFVSVSTSEIFICCDCSVFNCLWFLIFARDNYFLGLVHHIFVLLVMSFLACLYSCFCDLVTCYFTFHSLFYYILTNAMVLVLYCGFFYKLLFYFNNFYFTYVVNAGAVWFYSFLLIFLYFFCILILYDYCVIYLGSYIIYFMIFVCYILSLLIT